MRHQRRKEVFQLRGSTKTQEEAALGQVSEDRGRERQGRGRRFSVEGTVSAKPQRRGESRATLSSLSVPPLCIGSRVASAGVRTEEDGSLLARGWGQHRLLI